MANPEANIPLLDILAIAAHPDDVEITCGGLLIKMAKQGRAVGVLDLTRGEMGTHGDEHDRASEAAEAARVMGLAYRHNLGIEDAAVEVNQANKLRIAQILRDTKAELVILPHWEQRHPDHLACTRLGYDACFLAGLKKIALSGEPSRPRKIIYVSYFRNTDYSFLVDISDEMEQKCLAVSAYKSQFPTFEWRLQLERQPVSARTAPLADKGHGEPLSVESEESGDPRNIFSPGVNIYDLMRIRARALGQLVRVQYAEAYTIKEHMLVNDPQKMPVASI